MKSITRDQSRDTGLALVVLLLVGHLATGQRVLVSGAVVALVASMLTPLLFRPLAVVWLGLSHVLGSVTSKVLFALIFYFIVTPIGLVRRLAGKDPLRLRAFKTTSASALVTRKRVVSATDLDRPY